MDRMNSVLSTFIALLRIILGVVFVFASISKMADPGAFADAIVSYRIISGNGALLVATILPWIELLCGFGLLFGLFVRGSALLVAVMLIVFTLAVLSALWRGLDISCGCFTMDPAAERLGWWKTAEDVLLLVMSLLVLCQPTYRLTLGAMDRQKE
jgi:uncharacterized membrane protein YphA (DoxX/SURF4 family)